MSDTPGHSRTHSDPQSPELPEPRLRSLIHNLPNILTVVDPAGTVIYINHPIAGLERADVIGRPVTDFVEPDFHELLADRCEQVLKTGDTHSFVSQAAGPDGSTAWYDNRLGPVYDGDEIVAVSFSATDITPQKTIEKELLESERRFRTLFDLSAISTVYADLDGTILNVNRRFMHLHGVAGEPGAVVGRNVSEFFAPEEREKLSAVISTTIERRRTPELVEYTMLREDGARFQAATSSSVITDPDGNPVALLAHAVDMTGQRQAEQRLDRILGSISEIVFETDLEGNLLFVNEAGVTVSEYSRDDLPVGESVLKIIDPVEHERARANIARILQGEDIGPNEYTLLKKSGKRIPVLIHSTPFRAPDNRITGMLGVIIDVSKLRAAEEEQRRTTETLRAERDRIQTILDLVGDIVLVLEPDGTVGLINRHGCEILGCCEDEIVGSNWFDSCLPERIREEVRSVFSKLVAGRIELARQHENPVLTSSGRERQISWRNSVIRTEDGSIDLVVSSGTDITEQRELELKLQQAQKMEAIGRLAGGIAHDFNNLLMVISGSVEMAQQEDDPARLHERCAAIGEAARTAAGLTARLLTFSSRQSTRPELVHLAPAVADSLKILERTLGEDIVLRVEHDPEDLPVMIDPSHLSQILMNIIINARDAMPGGGEIVITTGRADLTLDDLQERDDLVAGAYARLSVSDRGAGMDEDQRARLFDPFFTTKEPGEGTGLGMATVYGVVVQNRGLIDVESSPGTGTTITVFLPLADRPEKAQARPAVSEPDGFGLIGGSERIVIVEDEEAVRDLVHEILTRMGYSVSTFSDPAGTIAAFEGMTGEERPDLLITDVVMPGMSGVEMVRHLEEIVGRVPVLFMSGYTDDALASRGLDEGEWEIIGKPFSTLDLCARVRDLLNR